MDVSVFVFSNAFLLPNKVPSFSSFYITEVKYEHDRSILLSPLYYFLRE